ncbi:MAG: hypothetical protein EOP83_26025 [Verrucomicrobiaceae bacterium]|nr:MAG: hypothetical protein EOP83_26025 [Verrucomicrobiaceae bacterium]
MATWDVERFRGAWLNRVWIPAERIVGPKYEGMSEWLESAEQPGYYYMTIKDKRWLCLFTDANVAFAFKMRWGGN